MPKSNIITQLFIFFVFAVTLSLWKLNALLLLMLALFLVLSWFENKHFYRLMRRLKWFYLVMFIIFAFNTPGEHIVGWPFSISPTYEGLRLGTIQTLRIAVMLAALSLILVNNTKQQLISGFYFILAPLRHMGFDTERFAARLWLTLHYVELQQSNKGQQQKSKLPSTKGLAERLNDIFTEMQDDDVAIKLESPALRWLDYVLIALTISAALFVLFGVGR